MYSIHREGQRLRPRVQFVSRYHEIQLQVQEHQVDLSKHQHPIPGCLATSEQMLIEPGSQVGKNFVLPRHYPAQDYARYVTEKERYAHVLSLTPITQQMNPPVNPRITSSKTAQQSYTLRVHEDVLLAAAAFVRNRQ